MSNQKEERFQKIAAARTNKTLNDLRLLSNCANKNNYSYTEADVELMLKAIDDGVKALRAAFVSKKTKDSFSFKKKD